jgi:hypothetical protein
MRNQEARGKPLAVSAALDGDELEEINLNL